MNLLFAYIIYENERIVMADPNLISTNIKIGGDFKAATLPSPVLKIQVKPEVIPEIIARLDTLKGFTKDSEIVQLGNKYSFIDKRNNQPLAEMDAGAGTLSMYKSPKDMAARIDSFFVSTKGIADFIASSKTNDVAVLSSPASQIQGGAQLSSMSASK